MSRPKFFDKLCLTTTLVIFFTIAIFSSQVYTPPKDLYQIESPHYKFVFEKDLYYFYEEINDYAEQLYTSYRFFFGTKPGKITVYILDDVDFTNSFALPSTNIIRLYVNPPKDFLALGGNVEDWSRFVFSHELTHIFYGNDVRDPLISWIPSQLIKNTLNIIHQPSYLQEGLSIYMESKQFGGRFEDDLFNMYLKAEILSNEFPRYYLGTGSNVEEWSPAGFNYMYGTILVRAIADNYGETTLREIINILDRKILSNISEAFHYVTNDDWDSFLNDIKQEYLVQYDLLSDKGYRISWFKINETYRDTSNLRTDGKSIYGYLEMPDKPNGIYKNDKLLKKGIREFDVNGKGDLVYLTTTYNYGYYTNKLYYECNSGNCKKLVDERVSTFSFIGNDQIAYSKLQNGLCAMYLYNIKTGESDKIINYGKYVINSITYDKSQQIIYFSANYKNQTDIYAYNLNNNNLTQITNDNAKELQLYFLDNCLYYSANYVDEIYNIFCFNLENQEVNQLTYYLIGAFNPIVLNNILYHLVYDYEGYHLTYLDLNNIQDEKLNSIVINSVPKNLIEFENNVIASQSEKDLKKFTSEKFYFLPYPYLSVDIEENIYYGAGTIFLSDALNYSGMIQVYTDNNQFYADLGLTFDYFTTNTVVLSLAKDYITSYFSIANTHLWHINKDINSLVEANLELSNSSISSYGVKTYSLVGPYSINSYNVYDFGLNLSYYSDTGFIAVIDKPFVVFNTKITPYVGYQTDDIYVGSNIDKILWRPYIPFEDGKYRFDGIVAGADFQYNFGEEAFSYLLYIQFDISAFYWLNLPIRVDSDMFK
jgi:hypothetical protein